jgi:tetratricopeptide (TPR) repeat protein
MAEHEREAASGEARIASVSPSARELLWVITRAREPVTERLIERLWSGESLNLEVLRKVAAELATLPPAARAQVEAQLPAEVLSQLETLGDRPTEVPPLPVRPLLAELTACGLLAREGEDDDAPFGFTAEARESATAWMKQHPREQGGRTEKQVWRTLGERYVGAFEALAQASEAEAGAPPMREELAIETGQRGLRYLIRAGHEELGGIAGRMLTAAGDAALRQRLLAEIASATQEAPAGAPRRAVRAALAEGIAEAADGDTAALERALFLYEQAIEDAEEAEDEGSAREAAALSQRWAETLERKGQHAAARDAFRRSAANARRAGLPRAEVIERELNLVRLGIRHGGDISAVEAALGRHIEELRALEQARGQGAAAGRDADRVGEVLAKALDIGVQLDLALERWAPAVERLDEVEALLQATGAGEHDLARARCQRYMPLVRLGRLEEAERVLEEALAVFREVGDGPAEVGTRSRLADLWDERGDAERAVTAARQALAASEGLEDTEMRANCHENLSIYLEKAGDHEGAREHQLADLVYRVVARLDLGRALRTLNLDVLRAAARGERHALPRLAEMLDKPAFTALRGLLAERAVPVASLEEGIEKLVETVQAGTKQSAPSA